jgi:patched 1 protein
LHAAERCLVCSDSWDRVYTRTSLALLGVLSVVLGLIAGYGLTMAIGLPFTSLEQTLPYILEGIGLDVIFILVKGTAHF